MGQLQPVGGNNLGGQPDLGLTGWQLLKVPSPPPVTPSACVRNWETRSGLAQRAERKFAFARGRTEAPGTTLGKCLFTSEVQLPPAGTPATSPLPGGLVERGLAPDPPRSRSKGALQWRPEGPGLENTCTERPHRRDVPRHVKDQPHSMCSRRTGPYPAMQTALCWQKSLSLRHGRHLPWKRPC